MRTLGILLVYTAFWYGTCAQTSPLLQRVANTTLQLPESPPRFGVITEPAFPGLNFLDPLAIVSPPGETNRLFVVEQRGRVMVITNLAAPNLTVFLDLSGRIAGGVPTDERGLLGMTFHPGYATNRLFYVFYTGLIRTPVGNNLHDILSRFEISRDDPNRGVLESELRLITQRDDADNHNGGDLHFGPDGYLYVSLGDEGGGNDQFNNSQFIDKDFFAGILRIDVDKRPESLPPNVHTAATTNYAVPPDNPFVGATHFNGRAVDPAKVRTEFYAVGLRNPWRMSFDPATGLLYVGDVGQSAREEVDIVVKGGNYGWAFREGNIGGPKGAAPPGIKLIEPIHWYAHGSRTNQGRSITGGLVYRGSRLGQLSGRYIFGDYVSGNIWALQSAGTNATPAEFLTNDGGIAAFGTDPRNGDILLADQGENTLKRLTDTTNIIGASFPELLSKTGAFADLAALAPQPGIVAYDLNVPFWSDNALKSRWFSVPNTNLAIGFSRLDNWSFPTGTVWVKHFELQMTNNVRASARRLETRFIVRSGVGVYGITYRWNDEQTDAVLVPAEGLDEAFAVHEGGVVRTQVWHYPSRSECLDCHTGAGGLAAGFNTAQLNRWVSFGAARANQIQALSDAGYFSDPVTGIHTLPALAHPLDTAHSTEFRVRSYLAANCAQCHQPGGTARGSFDARLTTPTSAARLIDGPLLEDLGDPENRVIRPGSLDHSMVLARIQTFGKLRMPPIDSTVLDVTAVQLLSGWITNELTRFQSFSDWQLLYFGSASSTMGAGDADPDLDGATNFQEYLTGRNPLAGVDAWGAAIQRSGTSTFIIFPQLANLGFEVQWTTNLLDAGSWQALDVPANQPFFSRFSFTSVIEDQSSEAQKFYRLRIIEP